LNGLSAFFKAGARNGIGAYASVCLDGEEASQPSRFILSPFCVCLDEDKASQASRLVFRPFCAALFVCSSDIIFFGS